MSYIGLDVGTSGCKAAIISTTGEILHSASDEYAFESPQAGYVELNPLTVWNSVKKALTSIAPFAGDAKTIAVSSIGEAMVILDDQDVPLYNGITYLDQRCVDTLPIIEQSISAKKLHSITGVSANQMFTLNKFIWFREHMPDVLTNARKFFLFGDYITYMLSGICAIDPGSASRTMFFDARNHCWSKEITDIFQIPIANFSKIMVPGSVLGPIKPSLAAETHLPENINVILGIHDQCAATLGSGCMYPGEVMMGQGSTESINCVVHKDHLNDTLIENQICFEPYIDNEHYIIITGNLTHGSSIAWFMRNFFNQTSKSDIPFNYDELYKNLPKDCGDVYFFPYLSKVQLLDAKNKALGGFLGIDVTVTREQMYRALLEGLCCETRINIELFEKLHVPLHKLSASGGVSKAADYMQMKADVLQRPIEILHTPEAGIMGLALISAVAMGDFPNYSSAIECFISYKKTYIPKHNYSKRYETYQAMSTLIKKFYNQSN